MSIVFIIGVGLYTNVIKLPLTNTISLMYDVDYSDERILVGASHNVFVGKVIRKIGNKSDTDTPKTQFEVEVIHNIKGKLEGVVIVDQTGGYENGILYLVHGGDVVAPADDGDTDADSLLEPGVAYLFATRYNEQRGWYTVSAPPYDKKLFSRDKTLKKSQLEILAKNDKTVLEFEEAYRNEIPYDADVKNNNAKNSYKK